VHQRYRRQTDDRQTDRRQTDGRTTTYSEHEHEFTFAKNEIKHKNSKKAAYTVGTEKFENYFRVKCTAQTMTDVF